MQDESKLFGKIVSKLNSDKKNAVTKAHENSYQTSVFENVDQKHKGEQHPGRQEGGSFKQLISNARPAVEYNREHSQKSQRKENQDNKENFEEH